MPTGEGPYPALTRLHGRPQHYAWGDPGFLPHWLGRDPDGRAWAEWWLGAHPSNPSGIGDDGRSFLALSTAERRHWLGHGGRAGAESFPFLLKVLCAAQPLSVQVHPSADRARRGFQREEAQASDLDPAKRNYKDPHPKPELLVAWTEFHALHGFASKQSVIEDLGEVPELVEFRTRVRDEGVAAAFEWSLRAPEDVIESMWRPLIRRLQDENERRAFTPEQREYWLLECHRAFSTDQRVDRGMFALYLLRHRRLQPGEGIFVDAGVPHAYLRGCGIELMAPSDNVLRCGLTPKHVDVDELLAVIDFGGEGVDVVPAQREGAGLSHWDTPCDWFQLRRVDLGDGSAQSEARSERCASPNMVDLPARPGPSILLVMQCGGDGTLEVDSRGTLLELRQSDAALLAAEAPCRLRSAGATTVFVASVPDSAGGADSDPEVENLPR